MTGVIQTNPKVQFLAADGSPLVGGKLYTYLAGTSTPTTTWQDLNQSTANTNPIILDARGEAVVWLDPALAYKYVLQTSASVAVWTADNITGATPATFMTDLIGPGGAALIGMKRTDLANSVATTLQLWNDSNFVNLLGDYLDGAVGTAAANTTALNNAISDLSAGGTIYIGQVVGDFNLNPITVGSPNIRIVMDPCTTLRWQTLGSSVYALNVTANNFEIVGGALRGPSSGTYVAGENGIRMVGSSTSSRLSGLKVRDCEIYNFGAHGVYAQFVNRIDVRDNYMHDCGLAGAMFLSCDDGNLIDNTVDNITPGAASNMYGLSLTHDSTGYSGGGKLATNPFCRGWNVQGNEISRINWEGIDTHGAYEVQIMFNRVYSTKLGIALASSSGAAANYAGYQNVCIGNIVDARNKDGTASGYENTGYGINLNGGSTEKNRRIVCTGNILHYKGVISNTSSGAIQASLADNITIADNVIDNWGGAGIYYATMNGVVSSNTIGDAADAADTNRVCISDGDSLGRVSVIGNKHLATAGRTAAYGFKQSGSTYRAYLAGNDFARATVRISTGGGANWTRGVDQTNYITESAGATTIDVSELIGALGVVYLTNAGTYTITNLTNAVEGQIVKLYNAGSGTISFDRSNARLDGSATQVLSSYDSIELMKTGVEWIQTGKLCANG